MNIMRGFLTPLLLLWIPLFNHLSLAVTYNDSIRLLGDLLKPGRYSPEIRPNLNQLKPMKIYISLGLTSVIELNDVSQRFKAGALASMWWQDELLQWDASAYGNVSKVRLSPSEVWKPTFILSNTFDELIPFDDSNSKFLAFASGYVLWQTGNVVETTCTLDVAKFPFDQQTCSVSLCTYGYTDYDFNITAIVDYEISPPAAEWEVSSSGYEYHFVPLGDTGAMAPCVHFLYSLKRKAAVFVLNIILPVILISLINNLVFLIPVESGEKISFAVTALLALALFMTLVSNILPRSSVPMISILLGILIGVSVMSVVLTVMIVAVYHAKESQEGGKPQISYCRRNQIVDDMLYIPNPPSADTKLPAEEVTTKKKKFLQRPRDFKKLARIVDIICFVFFNCTLLVVTAWYFIATGL